MATVNDFFCGCGGMGLGFKQAGFTIAGAWDFDKYAVESYRANVGDHVQQADISKMTWEDIPKADVWAFGFPCQDLSVAGRQAGLFEGKRSGLFFEVMRLLDDTAEHNPKALPIFLVAENVKGLRPYLPVLEEEYEKRGYKAECELYNSKYWGVPQSRERYFVIGTRKDSGVSFVFPEEQHQFVPKLSSILEPNVDEKYYLNPEKAAKIIEQALKKLEKLGKVHATLTPDRIEKRQNGRRAKENEEEMFTLTAQDLHGVIVEDFYASCEPKVLEEQFQSASTDKDGCSYCCKANYANGVDPSEIEKNKRTVVVEIGEKLQSVYTDKDDCAYACNARYWKGASYADVHKNRNTQIIEPQIEVVGLLDIKSHDHSRRVHSVDGISPTVTAVAGGTHHIKILEPQIDCINPRKEDGTQTYQLDRTYTPHGIVPAVTSQLGGRMNIIYGYRVRKLSPTEYGRLQGFPMDRWKQVVSNSQAYKQFGNAVTVNVAKALAISLKEALEKRGKVN